MNSRNEMSEEFIFMSILFTTLGLISAGLYWVNRKFNGTDEREEENRKYYSEEEYYNQFKPKAETSTALVVVEEKKEETKQEDEEMGKHKKHRHGGAVVAKATTLLNSSKPTVELQKTITSEEAYLSLKAAVKKMRKTIKEEELITGLSSLKIKEEQK